MKKTSIIDRDYFVANYKKIVEIKNTKLINAINSLLQLEDGKYLLFNKNTEKITNVSQDNVFLFNKNLVKDIVKSYDEFEMALKIVKESDFKEVLQDNIILFDKELLFGEKEDGFLMIYDREERAEAVDLLGDIANSEKSSDITIKSMYDININYSKDENEKKSYIIRKDMREKNEVFKNIGYFKSNEMLIDFHNNNTDKTMTLLLLDGIKINKSSIRYTKNKQPKIDISFKKTFFEEVTKELTSLKMTAFSKLIKKAEMFTYGNVTNSSSYISKKGARYTYTSTNPEFSSLVKNGKDFLLDVKNDYERLMYQFENEVGLGKNVKEIIKSLTSIEFKNNYFQNSINNNLYSLFTEQDSEETKITKLNIFINVVVEILDRVDEIKENERLVNFLSLKDIKSLKEYYKAKSSIDKSIEIFNYIQKQGSVDLEKDLTINEFNKLARQFSLRTRAGILDNKIDSYILNLRKIPFEMNSPLQEEYKKDKTVKEAIDNLAKNKYYDYFEIDSDYFNGDRENGTKKENRERFLAFSKTLKNLKMPVYSKGAFRIRKLGILKASGVYYSGANTIAVDWRYGNFFGSLKHEEIHRIDLSAQQEKTGRGSLIQSLYTHFDKKINEGSDRRSYYLKDEELIARAGEIASLLYEGNYSNHILQYKSGNISKEELWDKVKEDFNKSDTAMFMHSYERYSNSEVYISFENSINIGSEEQLLVDFITEYYKPFFTKEATNIYKLKISEKTGYEDREIEGVNPRNFTHVRYDIEEIKNILAETKNSFLKRSTRVIDIENIKNSDNIDLMAELQKGNFNPEVITELENKINLELFDLSSITESKQLIAILNDKNIIPLIVKYFETEESSVKNNFVKIILNSKDNFIDSSAENQFNIINNFTNNFDANYIFSKIKDLELKEKASILNLFVNKIQGTYNSGYIELLHSLSKKDVKDNPKDFNKLLVNLFNASLEISEKGKDYRDSFSFIFLLTIYHLENIDPESFKKINLDINSNLKQVTASGIKILNSFSDTDELFTLFNKCNLNNDNIGKEMLFSYKNLFNKISDFYKRKGLKSSKTMIIEKFSDIAYSHKSAEKLEVEAETLKKIFSDHTNLNSVINIFANKIPIIVTKDNLPVDILTHLKSQINKTIIDEDSRDVHKIRLARSADSLLENANNYFEFKTILNWIENNIQKEFAERFPFTISKFAQSEINNNNEKIIYLANDVLYKDTSKTDYSSSDLETMLYPRKSLVSSYIVLKEKKFDTFLKEIEKSNFSSIHFASLIIVLNKEMNLNLSKEIDCTISTNKSLKDSVEINSAWEKIKNDVNNIYEYADSVNPRDIIINLISTSRTTNKLGDNTIRDITETIKLFSKEISEQNLDILVKGINSNKKIDRAVREFARNITENLSYTKFDLLRTSYIPSNPDFLKKVKSIDELKTIIKKWENCINSLDFMSKADKHHRLVEIKKLSEKALIYLSKIPLKVFLERVNTDTKTEKEKIFLIGELVKSVVIYAKENNIYEAKTMQKICQILDKVDFHKIKIRTEDNKEEQLKNVSLAFKGILLLEKVLEGSDVLKEIPLRVTPENDTLFIPLIKEMVEKNEIEIGIENKIIANKIENSYNEPDSSLAQVMA